MDGEQVALRGWNRVMKRSACAYVKWGNRKWGEQKMEQLVLRYRELEGEPVPWKRMQRRWKAFLLAEPELLQKAWAVHRYVHVLYGGVLVVLVVLVGLVLGQTDLEARLHSLRRGKKGQDYGNQPVCHRWCLQRDFCERMLRKHDPKKETLRSESRPKVSESRIKKVPHYLAFSPVPELRATTGFRSWKRSAPCLVVNERKNDQRTACSFLN
jgi:hypothetical protein